MQLGDTTVSVHFPDAGAAIPERSRTVSGLVLQVQVAGETDEIPVTKKELTLGRAQDNDVILEDPQSSGHHTSLRFRAGMSQVMDLGSLNGTQLNGRALPSRVPTPFRPGDLIQVGGYTFAVRMATAEAPAPALSTPQVRLE
ncbi:unnamed protein product, partial [marine sediment metagenome]